MIIVTVAAETPLLPPAAWPGLFVVEKAKPPCFAHERETEGGGAEERHTRAARRLRFRNRRVAGDCS